MWTVSRLLRGELIAGECEWILAGRLVYCLLRLPVNVPALQPDGNVIVMPKAMGLVSVPLAGPVMRLAVAAGPDTGERVAVSAGPEKRPVSGKTLVQVLLRPL